MENNINLRDYVTIGRDVLRDCWLWTGQFKNEVPWFKSESARRLIRDKYGNGVEPGAHVSRCLLGNAECVNPAHTFFSTTDLERLEKFIRPARADGCMIWTGCTRDEYPLIMINNVTRRAARVLWKLKRGPIPSGFMILHTCDERRCMAIGETGGEGHLWLGTAADNTRDMIEKKRGHWQKAVRKPAVDVGYPTGIQRFVGPRKRL